MRRLLNEKKGSVLGLPIYLIVTMVVAIAVIAAVIYMIPQGTQTMNVLVASNAVISGDPGAIGAGEFSLGEHTSWITVTTNNERADPIEGAMVTLVGANAAAQGTTLANGSVQLTFSPQLDANINLAYMKLTVKAAGFQDYSDEQAIMIYRLG